MTDPDSAEGKDVLLAETRLASALAKREEEAVVLAEEAQADVQVLIEIVAVAAETVAAEVVLTASIYYLNKLSTWETFEFEVKFRKVWILPEPLLKS